MNTSRTDCHSKDNFLCYTDQGSFLGLRALGRGPVVPFTWLLAQQPDEAAVIQLHIPTKPAGYPEVMSATHSNLIAATVPISSRPGDAVSSGRFW